MKQSKDTKYNSKPQNPISYKHETVFYVKDRKRYAGQLTFCFDEGDHRKTVYGKSEREVRAKRLSTDKKYENGSDCILFDAADPFIILVIARSV